MKVAFRVDGGDEGIGLGHLVRCIALANEWKKRQIEVFFICKNYPLGVSFLIKQNFEVKKIGSKISLEEDLQQTIFYLTNVDMVIADSYRFTTEYLRRLSKFCGWVCYFDDLLDRKLPLEAVIGNVYSSPNDFKENIEPDALLLTGPQYVPLRAEFDQRFKYIASDEVKKVLITFGGEDNKNCTQQIVEFLHSYPKKLKLKILLGAAYRYQKELSKALSLSPHDFMIYQDLKNVIPLFQETDLAITAASTTVWELAVIGLPRIVIQTAVNQSRLFEFVKKNDLGFTLGTIEEISQNDFFEALKKCENREFRRNQTEIGQNLIKGDGANRIVNALLNSFSKQIILREMDRDPNGQESKLMWTWRNDPITREMSFKTEIIPWEEHYDWYNSVGKNENYVFLMGYLGGDPVGVVRFDILPGKKGKIHINVSPQNRGKGIGNLLLSKACAVGFNRFLFQEIIAEIKEKNISSITLFEKNGFRLMVTEKEMRKYKRVAFT